jgi:hypothetical protein
MSVNLRRLVRAALVASAMLAWDVVARAGQVTVNLTGTVTRPTILN